MIKRDAGGRTRRYVSIECPSCHKVREIREDSTTAPNYTKYCVHCVKTTPARISQWKKYSIDRKGNDMDKAREASMKVVIGSHHTDEWKRNLSEKLRGEKSYMWKGGISRNHQLERQGVEFKIWRNSLFERDNYTCQSCGSKGVFLHPHHIKNFSDYPELRYDLNNGVTLCRKCHYDFHHLYGRKNNTFVQVESFIGVKAWQ
jgi:5-methylcytosine-specific restriction endonuclease McrA